MTPAELKRQHEIHNPGSHYFDRDTMRFFGDTMSNYGVITHEDCYELRRKRPVKHGLRFSTYFDKNTFETLGRSR